MRILIAIAAAILACASYAAPVAYTTRGLIVLSCDGAEVSRHTVETEMSERALKYALDHGGKASCRAQYPDKTIVFDVPLTSSPPPPPACPAQPADESRPGTCPAGSTGTWTQTLTYSSAPAPTCWVAGAWTPATAPAGACNRAPTIAGTPVAAVVAGQAYSFTPTAADPDGDTLAFTIANKPSWAGFDTATGKLWGVPASAQIGVHSSIVITVTDGTASASTSAFSITVTAPPPPPAGPALTYSPTAGGTYAALAAATVSGSINVRLEPCPSSGPWTFSIDGTAAATQGECPIALPDDDALLDTKTLANGAHTVRASGPSTITATFTVANAAPPPPPPPPTGSATLSWTPPTQNEDGSALTNLAGYRVIYGNSATALSSTVQVANPSLSSYIVGGLSAGSWYFAVRAYSTSGSESANSNVATKVVP